MTAFWHVADAASNVASIIAACLLMLFILASVVGSAISSRDDEAQR